MGVGRAHRIVAGLTQCLGSAYGRHRDGPTQARDREARCLEHPKRTAGKSGMAEYSVGIPLP